MRPHLVILPLALLGLADSQASGQTPAPPRGLEGFEYHVEPRDGQAWWRRWYPDKSDPNYVVYVKPLYSMHTAPSFAVVDPSQVVTYNSGIDLRAMAEGPDAPGFSAGGGGEAVSAALHEHTADCENGGCPYPPAVPEPGTNDLAQFLRRNRIDMGQVLAAAAVGMTAIVGLLGALVALLVRRR